MSTTYQKLLLFLSSSFDPEGVMHILAVSAVPIEDGNHEQEIRMKVRIALTFKEDDSINPYFDGIDLFVAINTDGIRFTNEDEWADGPPIMEGSPIELAVGWVSELAQPLWVSPEANEATARGLDSNRPK